MFVPLATITAGEVKPGDLIEFEDEHRLIAKVQTDSRGDSVMLLWEHAGYPGLFTNGWIEKTDPITLVKFVAPETSPF